MDQPGSLLASRLAMNPDAMAVVNLGYFGNRKATAAVSSLQ